MKTEVNYRADEAASFRQGGGDVQALPWEQGVEEGENGFIFSAHLKKPAQKTRPDGAQVIVMSWFTEKVKQKWSQDSKTIWCIKNVVTLVQHESPSCWRGSENRYERVLAGTYGIGGGVAGNIGGLELEQAAKSRHNACVGQPVGEGGKEPGDGLGQGQPALLHQGEDNIRWQRWLGWEQRNSADYL